MSIKRNPLPYGGGGLPKTRIIDGKIYHLWDWGPYKPRKRDLDWAKSKAPATSARTVKIGRLYAIYVKKIKPLLGGTPY